MKRWRSRRIYIDSGHGRWYPRLLRADAESIALSAANSARPHAERQIAMPVRLTDA